jgi:Tfp pilus assembly protein PilF
MKKLNFTILIALFIALTGCATNTPGVKSPKEKKAELYYVHGSRALIIKDYTAALKNLLKSIEYDDSNPKAHNNLGMAYFFKNNIPKAKEHLNRALRIDPKNSDARNNLGSIYMHEKQYGKAKQEYLTVLKDLTYPLQHRVYYNLALIDLVYKRTDKAIANLLKSVKENDGYCPSFYQLGLIANQKREYHQSLEYFKKASSGTCVNDPKPHYQVADALLKLNEHQRALFKFKEIISSFPESSEAVWSKWKLRTINITQMRKKQRNIRKMTRKPKRENFQPKRKEVESIKF